MKTVLLDKIYLGFQFPPVRGATPKEKERLPALINMTSPVQSTEELPLKNKKLSNPEYKEVFQSRSKIIRTPNIANLDKKF